MKRLAIVLISMVLIFVLSGLAMAGNTATQTVTYQVAEINELSASGNPAALIVNTATAGSEPTEVSNATTSYGITTNGNNKKITGAIDTVMPTGTTLKITLTPPTGGLGAIDVPLSATAADLVTGITKKKGSALLITYKLSATVEAGVVDSATKTVTLTITSS